MLDLSEKLRRSVDDGVAPITANEVFDRVERSRASSESASGGTISMAVEKRRRTGLTFALVAFVCVAVVVAGIAVVSSGDGESRQDRVTSASTRAAAPTLGILDRAPARSGDLPPDVAAQLGGVVTTGAWRTALDADGWTVLIAPVDRATGFGDFCALYLEPVPETPANGPPLARPSTLSCALNPDDTEIPTSRFFADNGKGERPAIFGIVPDGSTVTVPGAETVVRGENTFVAYGIGDIGAVVVQRTTPSGTISREVPGLPDAAQARGR